MDFDLPAVPLAQPGAAPQAGEVGSAFKQLVKHAAVDLAVRAGGAPGISDAEMGQNVMNACGWIGGGMMQQIQQAVEQAVQQALPDAVQQAVQNAVQPLKEMAVDNYNLTARLHNSTSIQLLLPLRKGPAAPGAAAGAPPQYGDLPAPDVFPPTRAALYSSWTHVQMDALAAFYQTDFGQHNTPIAERKELFIRFISLA